jgi:hypothetical protein
MEQALSTWRAAGWPEITDRARLDRRLSSK